ncbi:MAG: hypothetical protein U0K86_10560 [Agathobacter sp.]|nr:hypothetical protein [Agathobacter sp.]
MLPAIVHDYFLNRGVPGSADMIPSASEPVLFPTSIIHNLRKKSTEKLCKTEFSLIVGFYCIAIYLGCQLQKFRKMLTDAGKKINKEHKQYEKYFLQGFMELFREEDYEALADIFERSRVCRISK